ncbi:MAG: ISKra4 family transposase [Anaerolineales bacterium]
MTSNSQVIIQDIRADFEKMMKYVTGDQARTATADATERGLFKMLMEMGLKLLTLFFVMRSQNASRETLKTADGNELYYHRDTKRRYVSIFGKLRFARPYFYARRLLGGKGKAGQIPLDAELSLGDDCYSDLVREVSDYLGVYGVYHKSCDILERLLGLNLSTRVLQTNLGEDAADVSDYYAQKPGPEAGSEAEILVIQADGKGVPMILAEVHRTPEETQTGKVRLGKGEKYGHKKEAIVTSVYSIEPFIRTPEQVVASYYDKISLSRPSKPQNKHLWATLDGKDAALSRLAAQVGSRVGDHIQHIIALCDGCPSLQIRIAKYFPDFTLILDFIHANEYLWKVANALFGETNDQRFEWMRARTLQLLSGKTKKLIAEFRTLAHLPWRAVPGKQPKLSKSKCAQLLMTANYFERNLPFMDYPSYLSNGWPIASGVIEGACRHFVKDRCELSGMRWLQSGAENLLRLRAVAENNDWDDYQNYRKQQRHLRLYGSLNSSPQSIEAQSLAPRRASSATVVEPQLSNKSSAYCQMPLAT